VPGLLVKSKGVLDVESEHYSSRRNRLVRRGSPRMVKPIVRQTAGDPPVEVPPAPSEVPPAPPVEDPPPPPEAPPLPPAEDPPGPPIELPPAPPTGNETVS